MSGGRLRAKRVQRRLLDEAEDQRVEAFLAALRAAGPYRAPGK
jgi:hypothetical protein